MAFFAGGYGTIVLRKTCRTIAASKQAAASSAESGVKLGLNSGLENERGIVNNDGEEVS